METSKLVLNDRVYPSVAELRMSLRAYTNPCQLARHSQFTVLVVYCEYVDVNTCKQSILVVKQVPIEVRREYSMMYCCYLPLRQQCKIGTYYE